MARFLSQMKTSFLGLFIILILISCSGVKKGSGNLLEQKALLWEIMVPGAKNPSYVFGTIHIIPAEDFFYPAGTLAAFDKVDKVLTFIVEPIFTLTASYFIYTNNFFPSVESIGVCIPR